MGNDIPTPNTVYISYIYIGLTRAAGGEKFSDTHGMLS